MAAKRTDYRDNATTAAGPAPATFEKLVEVFREKQLPTLPLKPEGLKDWHKRLKALLRHCGFTHRPLVQITVQDCGGWHTRRKAKVGPSRLNHELDTLRKLFTYARESGWMGADPSRMLQKKRIVHRQPDPPTAEEFRRLISELRTQRTRDAADLVELMAYSGLRVGAACGLKWEDVDFNGNSFRVSGKWRDEEQGEYDTIPLFPSMRKLLLEIYNDRTPKPEPATRILRIRSCRDSLRRACKAAGLRRMFKQHDLRKYFATQCLLEFKVPVRTVAGWLQHKDGGALLLRTYATLMDKHSHEEAARIEMRVEPKPSTVVPMNQASG